MARTSAEMYRYRNREPRPPTPHERLAADVKAERTTLADAMAEIDKIDPVEGRLWLAFAFGEPDGPAWALVPGEHE